MIFFSSDPHYDHTNIIKYCGRTFSNVEAMNENLIEAWNRVVGYRDSVYFLGDLMLGENYSKFLRRLNGQIFILNNEYHHDKTWIKEAKKHEEESFSHLHIEGKSPTTGMIYPLETISVEKQIIVLCHFPLEEWDRKHHGAWHLHGHQHNRGDSFRKEKKLDVGVDNAKVLLGEYRPFSFDEVRKVMETRGRKEFV